MTDKTKPQIFWYSSFSAKLLCILQSSPLGWYVYGRVCLITFYACKTFIIVKLRQPEWNEWHCRSAHAYENYILRFPQRFSPISCGWIQLKNTGKPSRTYCNAFQVANLITCGFSTNNMHVCFHSRRKRWIFVGHFLTK